MYCITIIEPAHPREELTISQQINEIIGPFESEDIAIKWVERFQTIGTLALAPPKLHYLISEIKDPKTI